MELNKSENENWFDSLCFDSVIFFFPPQKRSGSEKIRSPTLFFFK